MASGQLVTLDTMVDTLKAAAESSRLRILALLSRGDLTVSDLTEILNQSQPRVSRHLKLLLDAGLIGRYQEGSWAFFRLADDEAERNFALGLVGRLDRRDGTVLRDLERLDAVKRAKQARAADYFGANADQWDRLRALHVPDDAVEAARMLRPSGRLVIVDFAPHSLEFLREEHAHLRLGFPDRQIVEWLAEAGLEHEETIDFAPADSAGLTVKLWLGRDRRLLIAEPETEQRQFTETA